MQPGGQLTITTDVENYPGFADVIQGPWLMDQMKAQAIHVGTEIISDHITEVNFKRRPFRLRGNSGELYTADAIVIATGAQARWLGLDSEHAFQGHGVSACATCDGFFYKGKNVLVVGGGNTAVEEALFLTNFAAKVTVVHRRNAFKAERILQDRLFKNPKVEVIWDSTLEAVLGNQAPKSVTGVRLKDQKTGKSSERPVDGVFIAIGHEPADGAVQGPYRDAAEQLHHHRAQLDNDQRTGRVRRRRRHRRNLSAGDHRSRDGMHGGPRGRKVSRPYRGGGPGRSNSGGG